MRVSCWEREAAIARCWLGLNETAVSTKVTESAGNGEMVVSSLCWFSAFGVYAEVQIREVSSVGFVVKD